MLERDAAQAEIKTKKPPAGTRIHKKTRRRVQLRSVAWGGEIVRPGSSRISENRQEHPRARRESNDRWEFLEGDAIAERRISQLDEGENFCGGEKNNKSDWRGDVKLEKRFWKERANDITICEECR